ncbi:hypothetical protein GCM10010339_70560 [Streptomyces alanosinicus]|uniref:Uncharacterized protein n=1 Tax=Streptomyces alanosinicus TaxID=68171 RepID=A0A918YP72_9ACTN|nr:hypothetical protein GCM10010339_70560 [Streptomyces alanosinicus]
MQHSKQASRFLVNSWYQMEICVVDAPSSGLDRQQAPESRLAGKYPRAVVGAEMTDGVAVCVDLAAEVVIVARDT